MADTITAILMALIILFFYFLPYFIAHLREHNNRSAIGILNLLTGWTGLGWVAALVWAFTANK